MKIFEIRGNDPLKVYYCQSEEEFVKILKTVSHDKNLSVRKIDMTEEEYNNIRGEKYEKK